MKTTLLSTLMAASLCAASATAREYHVAITGDDAATDAAAAPLRTIQQAANRAMPGDVVTVHEGVYRERIDPPRGGEGEDQRITYQAAPGANVVIKGSEVVKGWEKVAHDTWKVVLPNAFFGAFNPYADEMSKPSSADLPPGGRRKTSATISCAEITSRTASRPASSAALGRPSA